MASRKFKETKKEIAWGARVLVTAIPPVWFVAHDAPDVLPISWVALGFILFIYPRWCRATKSDGSLCTNNSNGILGGCHIRKHKWENAWRIVIPVSWRPPNARPDIRLTRARSEVQVGSPPPPRPSSDPGLWGSPTAVVATVGGLSSFAAIIVSLLAWWYPVK